MTKSDNEGGRAKPCRKCHLEKALGKKVR